MPSKRQILEQLKRNELIGAVEDFELVVADRRVRRQLIDALDRDDEIIIDELLSTVSRDRLKELCRALGLSDAGRAKAVLITRLGADPPDQAPAPDNPISPPARQTDRPARRPTPQAAPPSPPRPTPRPAVQDTTSAMHRHSDTVSFIWSIAELLRGDYKQSEYGRVILPLTVLRRLDQVLAPTRDAVRAAQDKHAQKPPALRDRMLLRAAGQGFYNTSKLDFSRLLDDPTHMANNLVGYINGFSANMRDIVDHFRFDAQIERLDRANLLFLVIQRFNDIDLHPDRVSNMEMGHLFEELIRKFSEQSNETAGEHFTPREVIRFMVNLLFVEDDQALRTPGIVRTMLDPACGTGGMLSVAEEYLRELNPDAHLQVYGQELNGESYAICKSDMLIKGQDADNIKYGNSFSDDSLHGVKADYLISNPPFGVDWTKAADAVRKEHEELGHAGRFGPGLPRKNDGSLLFLLHMLSKMKPAGTGSDGAGSRLAIVFNGSPLFTGSAGSGESEIRRYLLEHDLLEAIIALPDQMFYNTGINTYIWVVSNRKSPRRRGKVQLINGVAHFRKLRKSLGDKRKELSPEQIDELTRLYADFREGPQVQIFANEDFGFHRITVERPLRINIQTSAERVARLQEHESWHKLASSRGDWHL